jgi:predicted enzyme related to lactoylglutathione lyase
VTDRDVTHGIEVERTDFVGLFTQDLERSMNFYGETLGLRRNERAHPDWPEFETGNLTLLLIRPEQTGSEFSAAKGSVALRVPDVAEARRKLEESGVTFHGETYDSGVCHMAFFEDPDGNALTLHHRYAAYSDGSQP